MRMLSTRMEPVVLDKADRAARKLGISRSAFIRAAINTAAESVLANGKSWSYQRDVKTEEKLVKK